MDPKCIRDIITNTVTFPTSAVTAAVNRSQDLPCSSVKKSTVGERGNPAVPCHPEIWAKRRGSRRRRWLWSKAIVCLPADYHNRSEELLIHRGSKSPTCQGGVDRQGVAVISYCMTEAVIGAEIWSLFSVAFDEENNFTIKFLLIDIRGWITCPHIFYIITTATNRCLTDYT